MDSISALQPRRMWEGYLRALFSLSKSSSQSSNSIATSRSSQLKPVLPAQLFTMQFLTVLSTTALFALVSALPAASDAPSALSVVEVKLPAFRPITGIATAGEGSASVKREEEMGLEKRATLVLDVWQSKFYCLVRNIVY